jgi:DNA-binding HxlR family transcriptional regulator
MDADDDGATLQSIANVIRNRGRHIDLYSYILKHPEELTKGVLVAGSIGSGKTQRAMRIVRAALHSNYGVLVFDPSNDYERLLSVEPEAVVIDYREFTINPLEPPTGMRLDEWTPTFIQVFAQNYGLKDPSIAILQKAVNALTSPSPSSQDTPPTLEELLEEVRQYLPRQRSSEVSSHVSVQNRLESLLDSEVGRCVKVRRGFQPSDFEDGLLVIQLPSSGIHRAHELLVSVSIAKLFVQRTWRKSRGEKSDRNILVVLEEAHNYLSEARRADRRGERTQLERSLIEGRKLGLGFMVVDQMPHQVSSHVLGSTNMWIVGKLLDPQAKRVIGEALYLDAVWSREGLISLPTGGAFIRVEHMDELESVSPIIHRQLPQGRDPSDSLNLPALVAVPEPEDKLIPELTPLLSKNMMCQNERYLSFFERNACQYLEIVQDKFPKFVLNALNCFLNRTLRNASNGFSSIPEHYGLTSEMVETLLNREQKRNHNPPKASLGSRIYALEARCNALSSEASLKILTALEFEEKLNAKELNNATGLSNSWLSRVLGNLGSWGYIRKLGKPQKGPTVYRLTEHGKEILSWARSIISTVQTGRRAQEDNAVAQLHQNDLEWLLNLCREELELRQQSYVAGWRGSDELRESILNLEFKVQTLVCLQPEQRSLLLEIEQGIFRKLQSALESDILRILLKSQGRVPRAHLYVQCDLTPRSIRRHLSVLGNLGIIDRNKESERRSVIINSEWKELLLDECEPSKRRVRMTRNLTTNLLQHAIDNALLEMFIEHKQNFEFLSYVLGRAFVVEQKNL